MTDYFVEWVDSTYKDTYYTHHYKDIY